MIRRSLHVRFGLPVVMLRKITTIRDKAWPVGVPIMLFHWQGVAYRSKQQDRAPVVVVDTCPIMISRWKNGKMGYYPERAIAPEPLWLGEGFRSQEDMDEWFSAGLRPGEYVCRRMMRFRLWEGGAE